MTFMFDVRIIVFVTVWMHSVNLLPFDIPWILELGTPMYRYWIWRGNIIFNLQIGQYKVNALFPCLKLPIMVLLLCFICYIPFSPFYFISFCYPIFSGSRLCIFKDIHTVYIYFEYGWIYYQESVTACPNSQSPNYDVLLWVQLAMCTPISHS